MNPNLNEHCIGRSCKIQAQQSKAGAGLAMVFPEVYKPVEKIPVMLAIDVANFKVSV